MNIELMSCVPRGYLSTGFFEVISLMISARNDTQSLIFPCYIDIMRWETSSPSEVPAYIVSTFIKHPVDCLQSQVDNFVDWEDIGWPARSVPSDRDHAGYFGGGRWRIQHGVFVGNIYCLISSELDNWFSSCWDICRPCQSLIRKNFNQRGI